MTNKEILDIALQQSAYDCNCDAADFLSEQDVVTISKANPKARKYIPLTVPIRNKFIGWKSSNIDNEFTITIW